MNYVCFEFLTEDAWREILAFKTGERGNRGGNRVINMSVSVLSCNFGIKLVLSQNWGACVNPKFWRVRVCLWVHPMEGRSDWIVDRLNRSLDADS